MANRNGNRLKNMQRHGSLPKIDYSPSTYVQNLLSEGTLDEEHLHNMFCEMDVLEGEGEAQEWKEYARWVKYEEDVEEGGGRWSKPHVASLNMQALFDLRNTFASGCVILDVDAKDMTSLIEIILDNLLLEGRIKRDERTQLQTILSRRHHHQHDRRGAQNLGVKRWHDARVKLRAIKTFSDMSQTSTGAGSTTPPRVDSTHSMGWSSLKNVGSANSLQLSPSQTSLTKYHNKYNTHFVKKIPKGAEVANIMIGEIEGWNKKLMVYVRLKEATVLENVSEVALPTRFMFILIGPKGEQARYCEMGRSMAAMTVDEVFREVAYKGNRVQDFLAGIDEFMDHVTVLPPGEWDPSIRLEPPSHVPAQIPRRISSVPSINSETRDDLERIHKKCKDDKDDKDDDEVEEEEEDEALQRTGRFCGGLIEDIKRKIPFYKSDFVDALHIQCFASFVFLYLATLTPNVTFGAVLGRSTNNMMGAMECILAAAITGVAFALTAGQPLNILGSTGPMLVLETIIYNFCVSNDLDYMPYRFWIGMWTALLLIIMVVFDLSALVKYITRFTEECFATLIAAIFIYEAIKRLIDLGGTNGEAPYQTNPDLPVEICNCTFPTNMTQSSSLLSYIDFVPSINETSFNVSITANFTEKTCYLEGGSIHCQPVYVANAFLFSIILFVTTLFLSLVLGTWLRETDFFTSFVRQTISDFGVLIAIVVMVIVDYFTGIPTPKLTVPDDFVPTNSEARGWIINPLSEKNPWWLILTGIVPAILGAILIFMDQQITAVIVNRKEHKLKKKAGYNLDLLIVAILVIVCSILGLPWYVAATVSAVAHVASLKRTSETAAPGEKPVYLGAREQRVTALLVGILSGVTIFLTPVLKLIPLAVLYGVFMYMGVIALFGMQLITRIVILFKPPKYQPDLPYLRHVRLWRVYLFTAIQVICFAILWIVKSFKDVSIVFPIMVLAICFVRKGLDWVFTQDELKWLDQILPPFRSKSKHKKDDDAEDKSDINEKTTKNGHTNIAYDSEKDTREKALKLREKPIKFYVAEDHDDHNDHLSPDNYYNKHNTFDTVIEETPIKGKDAPPDVTFTGEANKDKDDESTDL